MPWYTIIPWPWYSHDIYNLYPYYYNPGAFLQFGTLEAVFSSVLSLRLCYDTPRWKTGRAQRKCWTCWNWMQPSEHCVLGFTLEIGHMSFRQKKWLQKYRDDSWPHFMAVNWRVKTDENLIFTTGFRGSKFGLQNRIRSQQIRANKG